jgi:hypothetical protein
VEHDGRRHRLGLHLGEVNLHKRRRQLAGRAVVVVSGNIRNLAQIGPVVRRVDPLNRADVAASAAILVPASALVPAHESGHLVSVGVLTGASDNHFGGTVSTMTLLNPFSGFKMERNCYFYLYKLCYSIDSGR